MQEQQVRWRILSKPYVFNMDTKPFMLIIIKAGVDPQYAVVGAAHASLAGYLK